MVSSRSPPTFAPQAKNLSGPIPGFSGPAGGQRGIDQFRDLAVPLKKSKKGRTLCPPPPPEHPKEVKDSDCPRHSPPTPTTHRISPVGGSSMFTGSSSGRRCSPEEEKARERVRKALEAYNHTVEVLRRGIPKSKTPKPGALAGIYKEGADVLSRKGACVNTDKRVGSVPGVEVGHCFQHWGEMMVVGLHHLYRRGISFVKQEGINFAISIVATDSKENSVTVERILYVGEGGMPYGCTDATQARDQKLDGGNRALENSMKMKQPVRVICKLPSAGSAAGYVYVYYGLYLAVDMKKVTSAHGKLVFQFEMRRILGQPDLPGNRRLRANN